MTTSTTSIDIMGLQAAYANLHTDQERDYFIQRYHDVISSFRGKTSYDADNRPLLVMRSNLWASSYDVNGTDQTSFGKFSAIDLDINLYNHGVAQLNMDVFNASISLNDRSGADLSGMVENGTVQLSRSSYLNTANLAAANRSETVNLNHVRCNQNTVLASL